MFLKDIEHTGNTMQEINKKERDTFREIRIYQLQKERTT